MTPAERSLLVHTAKAVQALAVAISATPEFVESCSHPRMKRDYREVVERVRIVDSAIKAVEEQVAQAGEGFRPSPNCYNPHGCATNGFCGNACDVEGS